MIKALLIIVILNAIVSFIMAAVRAQRLEARLVAIERGIGVANRYLRAQPIKKGCK